MGHLFQLVYFAIGRTFEIIGQNSFRSLRRFRHRFLYILGTAIDKVLRARRQAWQKLEALIDRQVAKRVHLLDDGTCILDLFVTDSLSALIIIMDFLLFTNLIEHFGGEFVEFYYFDFIGNLMFVIMLSNFLKKIDIRFELFHASRNSGYQRK